MRKVELLLCFLFLIVIRSAAQPGVLVPGFGTGGLVTSADNASFSKIAVQPSGKIIVSRPSPAGGQLLRYNADGSQDLNFGPNAKFTGGIVYVLYMQSRYYIEDMLVQSDGKIIVLGSDTKYSGTFIFRFNEDGSVDGKFGQGGRLAPDIAGFKNLRSITLETSGKIVVTGSYEYNANDRTSLLMAKFNADGTPDLGFNGSGIRIVVETDGKDYMGEMCRVDGSGAVTVLVKAGSDHYLRRYKQNGKIGPTFGTGGQMDFIPVSGFDVDAAGRIAYIRGATCYILNANGTNAASHNLPADASATEIMFLDDGKILLARSKKTSGRSNFWIERLNSNGTPDISFGQNGEVLTSFGIASSITALAIYNRRVYAAGFVDVPDQYQHGAIAVYDGSVVTEKEKIKRPIQLTKPKRF